MWRSAPTPDSGPDPKHGWLTAQPYAHRGLHGREIPENSRAAFAAAIRAGHGIELDVRLSRDGFAVVFHDADLGRMTEASGRLAARTAADLSLLPIAGTADRIETLPSILRFVARRAPLLIELKTDDDAKVAARLCLSVRYALEGYRGSAAVMSFDPYVPAWFAAHAPHLPRGLVLGAPGPRRRFDLARRLLSLRRARPHFIAHDVRALPHPIAVRARRARLPLLAWTVRTPADRAAAAARADQIIYES